jgi:hypothetical protein
VSIGVEKGPPIGMEKRSHAVPSGIDLSAWTSERRLSLDQVAGWTTSTAPFKRNDAILDVLPIGIMVFPGTGIQDNLADKAKKLGIPVWRFGTGGA